MPKQLLHKSQLNVWLNKLANSRNKSDYKNEFNIILIKILSWLKKL